MDQVPHFGPLVLSSVHISLLSTLCHCTIKSFCSFTHHHQVVHESVTSYWLGISVQYSCMEPPTRASASRNHSNTTHAVAREGQTNLTDDICNDEKLGSV